MPPIPVYECENENTEENVKRKKCASYNDLNQVNREGKRTKKQPTVTHIRIRVHNVTYCTAYG